MAVDVPEAVADLSVLARVVLLTPPTNAVATPISQSRIDVSWAAVVGASTYRVYRNGVQVEETSGLVSSSTGLSASTQYTFQLSTLDEFGREGPKGNQFTAATLPLPDTIPPSVPVIAVTTVSSTTQSITLTTASTDTGGSGLASYTLQRATDAAFTQNLTTQTVATNGFPVSVAVLLPSTQYFYRCRAVDGAGNTSNFSAVVNATTSSGANLPPVLGGSTGRSLTLGVPYSLNLDTQWSDPEGQPITYTSDVLPAGLVQSGTRGELISGTPTAAGVTVANETANDGIASAKADFLARATASTSVKYATDFDDVVLNGVVNAARSGISTSAELRAEAFETGPNGATATELETTIKLSGNSCRLATFPDADSSSGGYWAFRPDGLTTTTYRNFYFQVSVYYPRVTLGYRYLLSTNSNGALKVFNLGQLGGAQFVVTNGRFLGFISAFANGNTSFPELCNPPESFNSNPWGTTVHHTQNAVDSGTPASPSTKTEWLTRYGSLSRGLDGDMDLGYDAANPYIYNRVQPSGWPDTRAATNAVEFNLDGWTTIEIHYGYNTSNPAASTIEGWAAPYGTAPTKIFEALGNFGFATDQNNNHVNRIELLNYDTERQPEVGIRPTMYTYYAEPIVSLAPIKFPGGFSLP